MFSIVASFGGGILVPVLINRLPFPLSNDLVIPFVLLTFWLTRTHADWRAFVGRPYIRHAIACGFEIMRATIVLNWTRAALGTITSPSALTWLIPGQASIVGPIFCGTLAGCGGGFMPLDKGLAALSGNTIPWGVKSACLTATFYVLATRGLLLGAALSDADASAYGALFLVASRLQIMTKVGFWAAKEKDE